MALSHLGAIEVLRESHEHLAGVAAPLTEDELRADSYCSEWNVAQVLSHLGSGAEISRLNLDAVLLDEAPPERSDYEAIWARWNALGPQEMADDCLVADEEHVATFEGLSDEELDSLVIPFFGGRMLDATGAVLMRLGEHAVHTWDVAVSFSPEAQLLAPAVDLLIDRLADRVGRLGRGPKPAAAPVVIAVSTTDPERSFVLNLGEEEVTLAAGSVDSEARLSIPAEAFIRLIYGRLDADHTPAAANISGPVTLEELRSLFPGF